MSRLFLRAGLVLFPLFLAGCASMDRGECQNANWYAIGLEDGADLKADMAQALSALV